MATYSELIAKVNRVKDSWIDNGIYGEPGILLQTADFAKLYERVLQLKAMHPGSMKWRNGISQWCEIIEYARKTFADMNSLSYLEDLGNDRTYVENDRTRKEYVKYFKYAVYEGASRMIQEIVK